MTAHEQQDSSSSNVESSRDLTHMILISLD